MTLVLALATCSALPQGATEPTGATSLAVLDESTAAAVSPEPLLPVDDRAHLTPPADLVRPAPVATDASGPAPATDPAGAADPTDAPDPADAADAAAAVADATAEGDGTLAQPAGAPAAVAPAEPAEPAQPSPPAPAPAPSPAPAVDPAPGEAAQPTRITIARIGVANPLAPVGLHADRTLVVPEDERVGGWYTGAPRPGQRGPAIIAGHNSWNGRTGIFWRLHQLAPGDRIDVHDDAGGVVTFTVDRLEQHPKDAFPTQRVYGNTDGPELRIITCGGAFDQQRRSHVDNIIVFATRTG